MRRQLFALSTVLLFSFSQQVLSAPIFADIFIESDGTSFLGGNVLGSPDGGGIFLGNPAPNKFLEVGFSQSIYDGKGDDIRIWDLEGLEIDVTEVADVFGSQDGSVFTFLGSVTGGNASGYLDIAGAMLGPINFLRIEQRSADAIEIDAIEAFHVIGVPEPQTVLLISLGLLGVKLSRRRIISV